MDSYIIQVQPQDELTVIIDKIIHTQAKRVFLLVPEQSRVAQHALNFRLLKREADALGKEIIIVSESPRVQNLALKSSLQAHQETVELRQGAAQIPVPDREPQTPRRFADILISPPGSTREASDGSRIEPRKKPQEQKISVEKIEKSAPPAPTAPTTSKRSGVGKMLLPQDEQLEEEKKITSFWTKRPAFQLPALKAPFEKKKLALPIPQAAQNILSLPKAAKKAANSTAASVSRAIGGIGSRTAFRGLLFFLVGLSSIVAAFTFYSILPKAKVYIMPVVEEVALEMSLKGDVNATEVSKEKFIIPVQIFEKTIEKVKARAASGNKEIREKATGEMTVYNSYSSAPQTLVKTTRFVSQDGKLFRTTETIVVPGAKVEDGKIVASQTTVPVAAAEPGEEYNTGPASFSIPGFKGTAKYLAFYGETKAPMTGGRIANVRVVSEDDYSNVKKQLEEELQQESAAALELTLPEGFIIPAGAKAQDPIKITSSHKAGEVTDEFSLTASIIVKSFAVRGNDVSDLLHSDFEERFSGKQLIPNGTGIIYKSSDLNFQKGTLDFSASLVQKAAAIIKEEEIQQGVSGKTEEEVRSFLASQSAIKESRVTFWPFWVDKMPPDPSKIQVVIEHFSGGEL